jgi:hypothetical protein
MLASELNDMLTRTAPTQTRRRLFPPSRLGDPYYVLLLFPYVPDRPYEENREIRGAYLEACLQAVKLRFPEALDIVGVATESGTKPASRSEDMMYLDAREWTPEIEAHAREARDTLELFVTPEMSYHRVREYPTTWMDGRLVSPVPKNPRNKLCPCDSGKKYKRCHGR